MTAAVKIKGLSKKFTISHVQESSYSTLVDTFTTKAKHLWRKATRGNRVQDCHTLNAEDYWALKDVSLEIEEGDRVGIIGKNGAGKSTLLKILSRITEPTSGSVHIRGRLSSLLEVGTGFHQELTGRENIFLNGAILGMKREEIRRKFDEIVAFADVEKFLDTPVKRFSSGMYMRLGFSIAAHLDSDILIIDEVLAVGDSQFQEKCLKKLNDLGSSGRTVLFVSHDLGSVLTLCNKGIYLDKGNVKEFGSIESCVGHYMRDQRDRTLIWEGNAGDEHIRIYRAAIEGGKEYFYQGEKPKLIVDYELLKPHPDLFISLGVWNMRHQQLARAHTYDNVENNERFTKPGRHRLSFSLDAGLFHEGDYLLKLQSAIFNKKIITDDEVVLKFPVYVQSKNTRFLQTHSPDGVNLGNHWNWNSHH